VNPRDVSWLECEDAARIPLTEGAVLDLLRGHFADVDVVYLSPHVPPHKELAARRTHASHLPPRERILALYEPPRTNSVLDVAVQIHEGFVVTSERICWKNTLEPARSLQWRHLDPDRLALDGQRLFFGIQHGESIVLAEPEVQDACAGAFHILALSGLPSSPHVPGRSLASDTLPDFDDEESGLVLRPAGALGEPSAGAGTSHRRSATPPPPHTTSFLSYACHAQAQGPDCSCWRCHTPLYETTPQCAFCGAEPAPSGWLRTG
jgi:hypothetical protein